MFTKEWFLNNEPKQLETLDHINTEMLNNCVFGIRREEIAYIHSAYGKVRENCNQAWLYKKRIRVELQKKIHNILELVFEKLLNHFFTRVLQKCQIDPAADEWKNYLLKVKPPKFSALLPNLSNSIKNQELPNSFSPQIIEKVLNEMFELKDIEKEKNLKQILIDQIIDINNKSPVQLLSDDEFTKQLIQFVFEKIPLLYGISIIWAEEISFLGEVKSQTLSAMEFSCVNDGRIYEPAEEHIYQQDCAWMLAHLHCGNDFIIWDEVTLENMLRKTEGHENQLTGFAREIALAIKVGYKIVNATPKQKKIILRCDENSKQRLTKYTLYDVLMCDEDVISHYVKLGQKLYPKFNWSLAYKQVVILKPITSITQTFFGISQNKQKKTGKRRKDGIGANNEENRGQKKPKFHSQRI